MNYADDYAARYTTPVIARIIPDDSTRESWVGSPGQQKFLHAPSVGGIEVSGLACGPRGHVRVAVDGGWPLVITGGPGAYRIGYAPGYDVAISDEEVAMLRAADPDRVATDAGHC